MEEDRGKKEIARIQIPTSFSDPIRIEARPDMKNSHILHVINSVRERVENSPRYKDREIEFEINGMTEAEWRDSLVSKIPEKKQSTNLPAPKRRRRGPRYRELPSACGRLVNGEIIQMNPNGSFLVQTPEGKMNVDLMDGYRG